MTLAFSEQLNGKPTHFIEKIYRGLMSLHEAGEIELDFCPSDEFLNHREEYEKNIGTFPTMKPEDNGLLKIHTMREDRSHRWKEGNLIHMVINNRQPNRFQFAPTIKCTAVQEVFIKRQGAGEWPHVSIFAGDGTGEIPKHDLSGPQLKELALNDGFKTVEEFAEYFLPEGTNSWVGRIIHWTSKRY